MVSIKLTNLDQIVLVTWIFQYPSNPRSKTILNSIFKRNFDLWPQLLQYLFDRSIAYSLFLEIVFFWIYSSERKTSSQNHRKIVCELSHIISNKRDIPDNEFADSSNVSEIHFHLTSEVQWDWIYIGGTKTELGLDVYINVNK